MNTTLRKNGWTVTTRIVKGPNGEPRRVSTLLYLGEVQHRSHGADSERIFQRQAIEWNRDGYIPRTSPKMIADGAQLSLL